MSEPQANIYNKLVFLFVLLTALYFGYAWYADGHKNAATQAENTKSATPENSAPNEYALKIYGGGWFGCISDQKYQAFTELQAKGENEAFRSGVIDAMKNNECVSFKEGETLYAREMVTTGLIQLHKKGQDVLYWVDARAVKDVTK